MVMQRNFSVNMQHITINAIYPLPSLQNNFYNILYKYNVDLKTSFHIFTQIIVCQHFQPKILGFIFDEW